MSGNDSLQTRLEQQFGPEGAARMREAIAHAKPAAETINTNRPLSPQEQRLMPQAQREHLKSEGLTDEQVNLWVKKNANQLQEGDTFDFDASKNMVNITRHGSASQPESSRQAEHNEQPQRQPASAAKEVSRSNDQNPYQLTPANLKVMMESFVNDPETNAKRHPTAAEAQAIANDHKIPSTDTLTLRSDGAIDRESQEHRQAREHQEELERQKPTEIAGVDSESLKNMSAKEALALKAMVKSAEDHAKITSERDAKLNALEDRYQKEEVGKISDKSRAAIVAAGYPPETIDSVAKEQKLRMSDIVEFKDGAPHILRRGGIMAEAEMIKNEANTALEKLSAPPENTSRSADTVDKSSTDHHQKSSPPAQFSPDKSGEKHPLTSMLNPEHFPNFAMQDAQKAAPQPGGRGGLAVSGRSAV
jgi:hypothetical protein